jgi:PAS domain S-box-containing protein
MALDGTVTTWNQGARRLFGYNADDMMARTLKQVLPEHQQQVFDTLIAEAGRGGPRGVRETTGVRGGSGTTRARTTSG